MTKTWSHPLDWLSSLMCFGFIVVSTRYHLSQTLNEELSLEVETKHGSSSKFKDKWKHILLLVLDIKSCCSDSPDVSTEIPCYISVVCALIPWDNHLWVICSNKPFHWLVPGALDLIARKLGHPWSVLMLSGPMWGESWWVPANSQRIDIKALLQFFMRNEN